MGKFKNVILKISKGKIQGKHPWAYMVFLRAFFLYCTTLT